MLRPVVRGSTTRATARAALCVALLAAAATTPAPGQAPDPEAPLESFGERIDVEVVEVEVRVADRKGRPVTGLSRDQFQLYDDGRPVEIEYFAEVRDLAPVGPAATLPPEAGAAEAGTEPGPALPAPVAETHLVIFVDQLHLEPGGRKRILADLQSFVRDGLPPGLPIMVVSFDRRVEVEQPFTTDRDAVVQALGGLAETVAGGIFETVRHRSARQNLEEIYHEWENVPFCDSVCDCAVPPMEARALQYAGEVTDAAESTLQGVAAVSSALHGVAGRTVLLLVNDGLEARPGLDLFHYIADVCPELEHEIARNYTGEDLLRAVQEVTTDAATSRVTIYAFEASGMKGDAADMTISSRQFRPSKLTQRIQAANLQHSLYVLADETGGQAILNTNRFGEQLEGVIADVGSYYSLGYTPAHGGDGRAHVLRVEVDAPHRDLRYRKAYRDKPLETRVAEGTLASLLFGYEANPLAVDLEIGEPTPSGESGYLVPVRIRVPLAALVLNSGPSGEVGQVRLVLTARDADGVWTPVRQKMIGVRAEPGENRNGAVRTFEVEMELPAGEHVLAVGVRDELGGRISFVRQTFQVASRR